MNEPVLRFVGRVHSDVREGTRMVHGGVPAAVEIFSPYAPALEAIEECTHLIVVGWLHYADRSRLQVLGRGAAPGAAPRGVFGVRSSDRPNPIGLTAARLVRRDGLWLWLERLDFVDGTPVIDVKRYSPGWDAIFAARTRRDLVFPAHWPREDVLRDMAQEGVHFHGERCPAVGLGARMVRHVMETWQVAAKDGELRVVLGADGCLRDVVQALTGATLGSGRLLLADGPEWRFLRRERALTFVPRPIAGDTDALLWRPLDELFAVAESPADSPR